MSSVTLALIWGLVGAVVGAAAVALVRRVAGRRSDVASTPAVVTDATALPAGADAQPVVPDVPVPAAEVAVEPVAAPPEEPVPAVPALRPRPHPADPMLAGDGPLVGRAGLGALTRVDAPVPLAAADAERLASAVDAAVAGDALVLPGPDRVVLRHALGLLHARLGDVPVATVPAPRAVHDADGGREPMRTLVADPAPLARSGPSVVLVEDAELHLRRGLDPDGLARLRSAAPHAVLVLVVGACAHDASAVDDSGRWLDGLVLRVGGDRIAAAGGHHPDLDGPLSVAIADAPLLADLAEAAAYARAAGRLPDVPLAVAARVAALLAGGSADEPAAAWQLGAAIAADTSEPPLLRFDRLDAHGLPVTVRASATLVARCVADPDVLGADLLEVLLEDADPVERLLVARRLAASTRPGLALPALDTLVTDPDVLLAAEARLVRGIARDRLGLASAADDYHAVATGRHGTLSAHGAFLLGGILETSDDLAPARAAYRSAIDADDPVHSAMAAFNLAWLEERAGDTATALAGYREVAEGSHPDAAPMAALNLATLLERGKRYAESESWYRTAVDAKHPDASAVAALSLGLMLERRQRPREARALFRQAAASGHAEAAPIALRRLGAPRR